MMPEKSDEPYLLTGPFREEGDELIFEGLDGSGVIAIGKHEVEQNDDGVKVGPDVRPRVVSPPASADSNTDKTTGWYCICIGQACYTYQCSDNKYLGQCFPVPCSYWGCKS